MRVVRIESRALIILLLLRLVNICEMLRLLIWLAGHRVEGVAVEVHLDVLWIQALQTSHHLGDALEEVREVGHASHLGTSSALWEAWELLSTATTAIATEIKLNVLLLTVATLSGKVSKVSLRMLLCESLLLSVTYLNIKK